MHYSILLIIIIIVITITILEIIKTNKSTHLHITIARENKWILFSYIELNISGNYFRYCYIVRVVLLIVRSSFSETFFPFPMLKSL